MQEIEYLEARQSEMETQKVFTDFWIPATFRHKRVYELIILK